MMRMVMRAHLWGNRVAPLSVHFLSFVPDSIILSLLALYLILCLSFCLSLSSCYVSSLLWPVSGCLSLHLSVPVHFSCSLSDFCHPVLSPQLPFHSSLSSPTFSFCPFPLLFLFFLPPPLFLLPCLCITFFVPESQGHIILMPDAEPTFPKGLLSQGPTLVLNRALASTPPMEKKLHGPEA